MSPHSQPVLEISNLRFGWPGAPMLLEVPELELGAGERLFVHGPSGSGKSTLLALIAGIHVPTTGSIRLLGQDLGRLGGGARDRLRGDDVGFVFQQFNLVPYLTVLENVCLPLAFSAERRARCGEEAGSAVIQARALLGGLGLDEDLHGRLPRALSVGQQQRVAVARALLGHPPLVVCDEPTSALDADARDDFMAVLTRRCESTGAALIFVSHDGALAHHFSRQLRLASGPAVTS